MHSKMQRRSSRRCLLLVRSVRSVHRPSNKRRPWRFATVEPIAVARHICHASVCVAPAALSSSAVRACRQHLAPQLAHLLAAEMKERRKPPVVGLSRLHDGPLKGAAGGGIRAVPRIPPPAPASRSREGRVTESWSATSP